MKITASEFSNSFFYIGSGYDLQPLLRFTHICENFIYTNLFIDQNKMEEWYDLSLRKHNDLEIVNKKVIPDFDEEENFELHEDYMLHLTQPEFIKLDALKAYQDTFRMALERKQFALVYTVLRKSLNREVKLFMLTAEGLASYLLLSQNGKYAPKIFCTIETGALEHPDGIMNDFFKDKNNKKPLAWARGFEPRYHRFSFRNNTLDTIGEYPNKILDFNYQWSCGWSYHPRQKTIKRYCKAFTSGEGIEKIGIASWKEGIQTLKNKFITGSFFANTDTFPEHDLIVVPYSLKDKFPDGPSILVWEMMLPVNIQLDRLFKTLEKKNFSSDATLHIIPGCMEDEGEIYHRLLIESKYKSITYLNSPFDFIDLKTLND